MTTCKDCIHYGICRLDVYFIYANNGDTYQCQDSDKVEEDCEAFTDKSEWIHLPCKVNSTVYIVSEYRGVIESKVRKIFLGLNGAEMIRTQHYDIPFSNWGKTTFLTREEAEKAFEEGKRNESI